MESTVSITDKLTAKLLKKSLQVQQAIEINSSNIFFHQHEDNFTIHNLNNTLIAVSFL